MPWTEQAVETLKKLWSQGLTTVEISKIIGVSKNSVIGKVHRLGLDKRPSPIKQKSDDKPVKKVIEKIATKKDTEIKAKKEPVKNKIEEIKPETSEKVLKAPKKEIKTTFTPIAKVVQKNFKENITLIELESQSCRWPFGDPKDEGFHFCGKKIIPGQTYCQEHNEKAYVKQVRKSQ